MRIQDGETQKINCFINADFSVEANHKEGFRWSHTEWEDSSSKSAQGILLVCCVAWAPGKRCCHEERESSMATTRCWVQTYHSKVRRRKGERGKWEGERQKERSWELWNSFVGCSNPFAWLLKLLKCSQLTFSKLFNLLGQGPNVLFTHDPQSLLFCLAKDSSSWRPV